MILIIGGACQGKKTFALEHFGLTSLEMIDGATCALEGNISGKALYNLQIMVERLMKQKISPQRFILSFISSHKDCILICDEIGLGVVPVSSHERALREEVGRLLCEIAKVSERVYRIYCGIPCLIKGEEPK